MEDTPSINNCKTCEKNNYMYICSEGHKQCAECIVYKGCLKPSIKQSLPHFLPLCSSCGRNSSVEPTHTQSEKGKLDNAIRKFQTYKRNFSNKHGIVMATSKKRNTEHSKVQTEIESTKSSRGRANKYNCGIRIMKITRKLVEKDIKKERGRSKIEDNTKEEAKNKEWCQITDTELSRGERC